MKKGKLVFAIIATIVALAFSVIVMKFDVNPAGPTKTPVGFSHFNESVFYALGTSDVWYTITQLLGYLAIGIAAAFGVLGLVQWIKRKNILAVDGKIIALGVLYIITIGIYAAFTKIMINGRPIIMPGETEIEPSFPSSHTMLLCVVCISAIMILGDYIVNKTLLTLVRILLLAMTVVMIAGRLLSGAHWFTDIVAGILISNMLLAWFAFAISGMDKSEVNYAIYGGKHYSK